MIDEKQVAKILEELFFEHEWDPERKIYFYGNLITLNYLAFGEKPNKKEFLKGLRILFSHLYDGAEESANRSGLI